MVQSKLLIISTPFLVAVIIFTVVTMEWYNPQMYYWAFFAIEMIAAALILNLFINENTVIHKILSIKWIVYVGLISYGLYLWHYPIYRLMQNKGFSGIQVITYGTLATFLVSVCSFYLLEKPILKLKRKYSTNKTLTM